MSKRVCDVCLHNSPTFKMKYKAKQLNRYNWLENKWEKVELREWCLDRIINAKEEIEEE